MNYNDTNVTFAKLRSVIYDFMKQNEWEKYDRVRILTESASVDLEELLDRFLWAIMEDKRAIAPDGSEFSDIKRQLADVVVYCLLLADVAGIDLSGIVLNKFGIYQGDWKGCFPARIYKGHYQKLPQS